MNDLAVLAVSFFGSGVFSTMIVFAMLREHLIDKAIDRREAEVYGPLLARVKAQEMAMQTRRFRSAKQAAQLPPPPSAEAIRLDAFPVRRDRR